MERSSKIILGIDPGTVLMGYCIVQYDGVKLRMVEMNVLKLNTRDQNHLRLEVIYNKVKELISLYNPGCFAIEAPFFGKNVQSMLKLGRAQGVAIAAAISAGLEVCEYTPRKIKQSITGNGNADKEQVWKMLQHILNIQDVTMKYFDASDALAVAVCHHFQNGSHVPKPVSGKKGWKEFISENPDRVVPGRG